MSCYVDGNFVSEADATLPIFDGGLLYGDGCMATIRVKEGKPLDLERHLKRLGAQCHEIGIQMPIITQECVEQLIANNPPSPTQRLRVILTGGERAVFDLSPRKGHVAMFIKPYTPAAVTPLKMALFSKPFSLVHAHFKTIANFNRLFVMDEAKKRGFDDGITLSPEGYLLEAAFGNLLWIVDDTLYIPDRSLPYYFGVTIEKVLEQTKLPVVEVRLRFDELPENAAVYRTNTMGGVVPIAQIENKELALISYGVSYT